MSGEEGGREGGGRKGGGARGGRGIAKGELLVHIVCAYMYLIKLLFYFVSMTLPLIATTEITPYVCSHYYSMTFVEPFDRPCLYRVHFKENRWYKVGT